MPLIITEIAIQLDGTFAVEFMNTDPTPLDITGYGVNFSNGGTKVGVLFDSFGVSTPLAAGEIFTIGHTSIIGIDYGNPDPALDGTFAQTPISLVELVDVFNDIDLDHLGQFGGTAFGTDVVYTGFDDRTPNPNSNVDNTGDFVETTPFSTSGFGVVVCFAAGTLIAGPQGETAVETLQIGDVVSTADGRTVPVKWIGRQTISKHVYGPRAEMVRIRQGTLGTTADLTVTADHGMIVDGLVINAAALINGGSIDWVPLADLPPRFTVYHVETEAHDVILANGAPAETFVDFAGRQAFDNYAEYIDLYGADRLIPAMEQPRVSAQRLVPPAIKARLGIVEPEINWGAPLSA